MNNERTRDNLRLVQRLEMKEVDIYVYNDG